MYGLKCFGGGGWGGLRKIICRRNWDDLILIVYFVLGNKKY